MKFFKLLALTIAMSFVLVSCSNDNDTSSSSSEDDTSSGVMSDLESKGEDVLSDLESKGDDLKSDIESGADELESDITGEVPDDETIGANANADFEGLENKCKGWGQGYNVDDTNRPISCLSFQNDFGKYDAFFIKEDAKNIYLTFDEGYENGHTTQILDVLKDKKCPAAFFVTMDYAKKNPDLINRMIDEGHIVGNHSTSHPSMPSLSTQGMKDEITELHNYVKDNFNYTMTTMRPPMGEWSTKSLAITQSLGYETYFWSFAYKDWETNNQPEVEQALTRTTSAAHNGAIYLLHAVSKTNTTILPDFIDRLRGDGYTFAPIA